MRRNDLYNPLGVEAPVGPPRPRRGALAFIGCGLVAALVLGAFYLRAQPPVDPSLSADIVLAPKPAPAAAPPHAPAREVDVSGSGETQQVDVENGVRVIRGGVPGFASGAAVIKVPDAADSRPAAR